MIESFSSVMFYILKQSSIYSELMNKYSKRIIVSIFIAVEHFFKDGIINGFNIRKSKGVSSRKDIHLF